VIVQLATRSVNMRQSVAFAGVLGGVYNSRDVAHDFSESK